MVDHTSEYAPIIQRAIAAYEGLMEMYAQDEAGSPYFKHCLAEASSHRDGLQQRLGNPTYLADAFSGNYVLSIDHFLESHRGEYGYDMPGADPTKAENAGHHLQALKVVMDDIIRVGRALELGV